MTCRHNSTPTTCALCVRQATIVKRVNEGATHAELAELYGISRTRVSQLYRAICPLPDRPVLPRKYAPLAAPPGARLRRQRHHRMELVLICLLDTLDPGWCVPASIRGGER